MSLSFRHRAGLVLAGLVVGAPLLGLGVASAATMQVTFSGTPLLGLNSLACPSSPSLGSLTVTPGTTIDFINRTGRAATLWAGDSQKTLPDKSFVPVTFTQGPAKVNVQMLPNCALDLGSHGQMAVTVTAPTLNPEPSQAQSAPATAPAGAGSTGSQHTAGGASGAKTPTPEHSTPPPTSPAGAGGSSSDGSTDNGVAAVGNNDDPFASAPAGDASTLLVGEPVVPSQPRSASGLLTLIATVGVVGVSAAAIRAIVAQRASRALIA